MVGEHDGLLLGISDGCVEGFIEGLDDGCNVGVLLG